MKTADAYPALGTEYDDPAVFMPSKRAVYGAIGILVVFALIFSVAAYKAGHGMIELISPYF